MIIENIHFNLLEIPTNPPRASSKETSDGRKDSITTLIASIKTNDGLEGIGYAYSLQGAGKAMYWTGRELLEPIMIGENALNHERLFHKVYWRTQTIGRTGLVPQVYSALDMALWDLKGKKAGLPVHKMLGGARESCNAYISHTGWQWMTVGQIMDQTKPFLDQGVMGLKVKVGNNPNQDIERISFLREQLGEEVWLAVDANEKYDLGTALAMGRFFQDEVGVGWFEEPISCENQSGYTQLANTLDIPIASGEMLFSQKEFEAYICTNSMDVAQPDITRLGGITPFLKTLALCEAKHIPVAPHLMPEIAVHLACAFNQITSVEYMPWMEPLFLNYPKLTAGKLRPTEGSGWGLELNPDALKKYSAPTS